MNKTFPWMQVARGIAAFIVVCHHLTAAEAFYFKFNIFSGFFTPGWNAVDLFFVLSGFIIYYVHARDLGHRDRWKHYITKRLYRIYPIYWLVALICLAVVFAGNSQIARSEVSDVFNRPSYLLKSFFLIPQPTTPLLFISWSLCFEVFFYLIFGLGILIDKRALWLLPVLFFGINTGRLLHPGWLDDSYFVNFLSANYHLEFLMGIVIAYCYHRTQASTKASLAGGRPFFRWLWIPGMILFALTWYGSLINEIAFGKYALYSRLGYGVASALIIFSMAWWEQIRDTLFTRGLLLLGDASYSLYLIHTVVLAVLFKLFTKAGAHGNIIWLNYLLFFLAAAICVMTGIVMHKKVEKPLLYALNKRTPKKVKSLA